MSSLSSIMSFGNMNTLRFILMRHCLLNVRNISLHIVYESILISANECATQNSKLFSDQNKGICHLFKLLRHIRGSSKISYFLGACVYIPGINFNHSLAPEMYTYPTDYNCRVSRPVNYYDITGELSMLSSSASGDQTLTSVGFVVHSIANRYFCGE